MLADMRLDWTIYRSNTFHASYITHSERKRLHCFFPALLSFQRQDTKVQPSKWAIPDYGTAQEFFFPMCGTVPQPNNCFKLVTFRCSFNVQTTVPRPFLLSRRRVPVTVANVTLPNANFYKSKLVSLNLANSLRRTFPANGSREFK